jgi:hypothetical protein
MPFFRFLHIGIMGLTVACATACGASHGSSSSPGTGGSGPASSTGGSAGSAGTVGTFTVTLVAADAATNTPAHSTLIGTVRDGPLNELVLWDLHQEADGCQLYTPRIPFCDPECATGLICVLDGVCRGDPTPHSVGIVTVTGLLTASGGTQFTMNPLAPSYTYQNPASASLLYPPADEGAPVQLAAAGGDYGPFELVATGILPLELAGPDPIPMQRDQATSLSWAAKGSAGQSRMQILLNISVHGGNLGKILCDVEDSGSLTVPALLVNQLLNLGIGGYPIATFTRRTAGSATIAPGSVEVQIISTAVRSLSIPGVTSCGIDTDCPSGQRCGSNRVCA